MRLTTKLTIAIVLGIVLVHAVATVVRVKRLQGMFVADISRDEKVFGHALAMAAARTVETSGTEAALDLVEDANQRDADVQIRWIWLERDGRMGSRPADLDRYVEALRRGEQVVTHVEGDDAAVTTYTPLPLPNGLAAIEVSNLFVDEQRYVEGSIRNAVLVMLGMVVFCGVIAWLVGIWVVGRPLRALVAQARRIGEGDFSARAEVDKRDELGVLAREMNLMAESLDSASRRLVSETKARIAALEQLRHADRLTTVGTLASGIAHELGTPLNVVEGHAELICEDGAARSAHENAELIIEQTQRMTAIIRQLMDFARSGRQSGTSADVCEVARGTMRMLEPIARRRGVSIAVEEDGAARARVPAVELQQVIANLVINGIQAMEAGGTLTISVDRAPADDGADPMVRLAVSDAGEGMDDETRARIFEPFFTTKEVGEGTGLGLAVVHGIVHDRGGSIEVTSERGHGSRFVVYLPEDVT